MARTLVRGSTQIMEESIFNDQIAEKDPGNGYNGIELAKIENSENIVLSDGTPVTGDIDMGSNKIINVAPGTNANDVVIKSQLDSISAGLDPKESVRAATTGSIILSGQQTIDGVNLSAGAGGVPPDRVLVKDQTNDPTQNGIYLVQTGAWIRSEDADGANGEVSGGMFTFVEQGTVNKGTGWVVIADGTLTPDSDPIEFTQFAGGGALTGGNGININGTTVSADVDGSTIINTAGTGDQIGIKPLGVTEYELAAASVITSKINDGAVTAIKVNGDIAGLGLSKNTHGDNKLDIEVDNTSIIISSNSLSIAAGGVGTTELANQSVTPSKLDNTIAGDGIGTTGGILNVNVDDVTVEIASDAIRVKALGIGTSELANDSVTKEKLNADVAGVALTQNTGGELDVQYDGTSIKLNGSNELYVDTSVMLAVDNYVVRESHNADSTGFDSFTLNNTPVTGSEMVFVNGILMEEGASNDYTISGSTVTFTFTLKWVSGHPEKSDKVSVTYFKQG